MRDECSEALLGLSKTLTFAVLKVYVQTLNTLRPQKDLSVALERLHRANNKKQEQTQNTWNEYSIAYIVPVGGRPNTVHKGTGHIAWAQRINQ